MRNRSCSTDAGATNAARVMKPPRYAPAPPATATPITFLSLLTSIADLRAAAPTLFISFAVREPIWAAAAPVWSSAVRTPIRCATVALRHSAMRMDFSEPLIFSRAKALWRSFHDALTSCISSALTFSRASVFSKPSDQPRMFAALARSLTSFMLLARRSMPAAPAAPAPFSPFAAAVTWFSD